jgi:hypothetical protein
MNEFKIIIAGSRNFANYLFLKEKMLNIISKKIKDDCKIVIISGTANGADKLGEKFANEFGYELRKFPADWERFGKSAGYKRNEQMADNADALVAFWDGISKGTSHMINIAKERNLLIRVIKY